MDLNGQYKMRISFVMWIAQFSDTFVEYYCFTTEYYIEWNGNINIFVCAPIFCVYSRTIRKIMFGMDVVWI